MYLGIDLGGTKIELIVLADEHSSLQETVVYRQRIDTPSQDYGLILKAITQLVAQAEQKFGHFEEIGIGTPGAVSQKTGAMKNCNSICLNGRFLVQDLELMLGKKVLQANDANCFALSESVDGAGKDFDSVFGVILGTGVGGGIVFRNQVLQGVNQIAGEWGHNPLPQAVTPLGETRSCYCGKVNCIETYLSGPGFAKTFHRHQLKLNGYGYRRDALPATAKEIAMLVEQGDAGALAVLNTYARQLAASLAGVINILDPDLIVLGGGMSNISALYGQLHEHLPDFVFSDSIETRIAAPVYGDSSGVRGAAWLTCYGKSITDPVSMQR